MTSVGAGLPAHFCVECCADSGSPEDDEHDTDVGWGESDDADGDGDEGSPAISFLTLTLVVTLGMACCLKIARSFGWNVHLS
jgi:hypothetical protein